MTTFALVCRACTRHISGDHYYNCLGCNFICSLCPSCEATHDEDHPVYKIRFDQVHLLKPAYQPRTSPSPVDPLRLHWSPKTVDPIGSDVKNFVKFLRNLTIRDREEFKCGEGSKIKKFELQNIGKNTWPAGTVKVTIISGESAIIDDDSKVIVLPEIGAGAIFEISIEFHIPAEPGRYVTYFRLVNARDERFGPRMWLDFIALEAPEEKREASPVATTIDAASPTLAEEDAMAQGIVDSIEENLKKV